MLLNFITKITLIIFFLSSPKIIYGIPDSIKTKLNGITPQEKVEFLTNLCWNLREKETQNSLQYGKMAIDMADSLSMIREYGNANNYVGVVLLHYLYKTKEAVPYFHTSLEIALKYNDSVRIGYSYNNLGDVYYLTGNAPLALTYAKRSMDYFQALNDSIGIAYSHINYGLVYRYDKRYDEALEHFSKVLKIRKNMGNKAGYASALREIAIVYSEMKHYKTALKYYNESLELNSKIKNKRWMAFSLDGIGKVYYEQGKYNEALEKFNQSLKFNKDRDHTFGIISNKIGIALVYSKLNRINEGLKELSEALRLAEELGVSTKLLNTYEAYSKFYININNTKKAAESFDKLLEVYDSLYSEQQFETLSELQNNFDITQKLKESVRDLEVKEKEKNFFIIIILLMATVIAVIFWRYRTNRKLNQELKLINESKEKLFSIISHDLRNPFYTLMGYIDLLKDDNLSKSEIREYVNELDNTTKNTNELLSNLLNLSASRIGKFEYSPQEFNISELVNKIVDNLNPQLRRKSITLENNVFSKKIYADQEMLNIVLRNLITNAIKYCNTGGTISLSSEINNKYYCISVSDNGIGMDEETRKKLFNTDILPSKRGTVDEKGTGLGLILSKEFIEKHNGFINVKSTEGNGSVFTFCIPATSNNI